MKPIGIQLCLWLSFLAIQNLQGGEKRLLQDKSPLEQRVSRFQKYMRASSNGKTRAKKAPPRKSPPRRVDRSNASLRTLHNYGLKSFQNLYGVYSQCLETHRFYVDFLKKTPDLTLKEFKIRTQQWKAFTANSLENLVLLRTRMSRQLSSLRTLSSDLESAIPEFLDTPYYSEWMDFEQSLNFETSGIEFFIQKLASLLIAQVGKVHESTATLIEEVEELHQEFWKQDLSSPRLRDQKQLVLKIKKNALNTRKWISGIGNHFAYAENRILLEYSRLQKNSFPSKTKITAVLRRSHFKKMELFQARIQQFLEKEGLESAILEARLERSKTLSQPDLHLPPLSKHLFFNHTRPLSPLKPVATPKPMQNLPDWI